MSRRAAVGHTSSGWDAGGLAAIEAWGSDARSAMEEGLQAVLTLALAAEPAAGNAARATPIHAAGGGLDVLFAALAAALLEEIETYGAGIEDVTIDGVLRRGEGVFVAWGYAIGALAQTASMQVPCLDAVAVESGDRGAVTIRATLLRPASH